MTPNDLVPHLFRTEFSKISSVLVKQFGLEFIEIAEDIASDTFLLALDTWRFKGVPENAKAWLYTVAKNKARNYISRNKLYLNKISVELNLSTSVFEKPEIDLSEQNISDSLLQMLFVACHPSIPVESQVALALRILCGFGIDEIATAFITKKETINKRLFRAREKLRLEKVRIEFPNENEINNRLAAVLLTLYLLFNEGYYSESKDTVLSNDLCSDAMRLTHLLLDHPKTNLPNVRAFYALMCFHSSRFPARESAEGKMILYENQNEGLWDYELIAKGAYYLNMASTGNHLSKYHLEASIGYWHTVKNDTKEKWENILQLYNKLLQIEYSPIAALNRTFALSKANSKEEALIEAEKLKLTSNHYYYNLLGELYKDADVTKAIENFEKSCLLAKSK
ncbi:MAG TPA: sigma-70 family RNA polymerase sigma factor, partial [Pedobacter sp.]